MPIVVWEYLLNFFLVAILVLASFGIGYSSLKIIRLSPVAAGELIVYSVSLGLAELALLIFLLGNAGLLSTNVAIVLLAALVVWTAHHIWSVGVAYKPTMITIMSKVVHHVKNILDIVLLIIIFISLGYILIAHAFMPPVAWDEVAYHLAIPKIYIQEGQIIDIPYIAYSHMPLLLEMLFALALLLGSEILAHLITVLTALLTGAVIYIFADRYFNHRVGLFGVVLFFSIEMVKTQAGVALVDVALGLYALLAIYTFWRWQETDAESWLYLAAIFSGLAASVKLTGAAIPLILVTVFVLHSFLVGGRVLSSVLFSSGIYGLIALLVAAPWYLKSFLYTGNPIWPFGYVVFGGKHWDALGNEYLFSYLHTSNMPTTVMNYLVGPWSIVTAPHRFDGKVIGFFVLSFAPIAIFFRDQHRGLIDYLLITCLGYYTIWFFLTHQIRFLFPILGVLSLLAAYSFYRLYLLNGIVIRLLLTTVAAFYLFSGFSFVDDSQRTNLLAGLDYMIGRITYQDFLEQKVDSYDVFLYVNKNLPHSKSLLMPYEVRGYYLDTDYVWANPISQRFIKFEQYPDAASLAQGLRSLGITHLVVNPNNIVATDLRYWAHMNTLFYGLVNHNASLVYEANNVSLYELRVDD